MEAILLKNLVNPIPEGAVYDTNAPLSFLEWKQRKPNISEREALTLYNRYVIEWFENNKETRLSQKFVLRQKYLYLLNQLQLFFSEEEKNIWYSKINLADEKELLVGIPYFAKKLKDIALYYLNLRKSLKNTKLKYSAVGSTLSLEKEIYNHILNTFNSSNRELPVSVQQSLPALSSLKATLNISTEEFYDDNSYFDHSLTLPVSSYYDLFHGATQQFFLTKGIVLSSSEWLFNSLTLPVTSSFDAFVNELTGNIFETSDSNLYGAYVQSFLAEDKFALTTDSLSTTTEVYEVELSAGNNFFYYPYGKSELVFPAERRLDAIALSSIQIDGATSGSSVENSDVIFVRYGDETKGAWLNTRDYDESSQFLRAGLKANGKTSFIFPYPGYGLSGQEIEWTGPSLETTIEYEFLSKELKGLVDREYWSNTDLKDTCNSILLNNTTLISSGGAADANSSFADKLYIRKDRNPDLIAPQTEVEGAWLFRFDKTAIPVSPNSENVILWPYQQINISEDYPTHLKEINYQQACQPVLVTSLNRSTFIPASSFELADKIYKLNSFQDEIEFASECVWLSGRTLSAGNYYYTESDGFNALFNSGTITRFIWNGENNASLDDVFSFVAHKNDCPFVTNIPSVSTFEWQKCSCKQVYHSPFGHPGIRFQDNNGFADFIVQELSSSNLDNFDLGSWRDGSNSAATNSRDFAWYKTSRTHGWGNGRWTSSTPLTSTPFRLKTGQTYLYFRATSKTETTSFPPYTVSYAHNTSRTRWIQAKKDENGEWVSANVASNMVLNPGDLLRIERQNNTTSYYLSTAQIETQSTNVSSVWATYDRISLTPLQNTTILSWPFDPKPMGSSSTQYPTTTFPELSSPKFYWRIVNSLNPAQIIEFKDQAFPSFSPTLTGVYTVSVTAIETRVPRNSAEAINNPSGFIVIGSRVFANVPPLTVIPQFENTLIPIAFETPSNGFLLEQSLQGWSYINNRPLINAPGARPYWAELFTNKDANTKYKGVYSWGYPNEYIDGYLPNKAPKLSPLLLSFGSTVEYERRGNSFTWNQPIQYKTFIGTPQWCVLSSDITSFSNLSSVYSTERRPDLTVAQSLQPSDIVLTNLIDGRPVEVFYYSTETFTWPISVTLQRDLTEPTSTLFFDSPTPWANLTNRYFPTVATVPTLEQTYSLEDVGGYFLPQNLGASQYINRDFTVFVAKENLSGTFVTENSAIHIGGRGLSKQDQDTLYGWSEDNKWQKESPSSGNLAGAPKKSLTKTLQTFIPYQSNFEETAVGLVTPKSKLTPWGGPTADQWVDATNEPKGYTEVRNVSAWADSQVLKQNQKTVDNWVTDVYGNQYGLFKQLSGVPVSERRNVFGELWTRTNDQMVYPSTVSLSSLYNALRTESFYEDLTASRIKSVDCFFDTILIETPKAVMFAQVDYDYSSAALNFPFDSVTIRTFDNINERFDQTWFFTEAKKVVSLFTVLSADYFLPTLYELELDTRLFRKIFPSALCECVLQNTLSSLSATELSNGTMYYSSDVEKYLISYTGMDGEDKPFVVSFEVSQRQSLELSKIDVYRDLSSLELNVPVVNEFFLQTQPCRINIPFSVQINADNNPTSFALLNYQTQVAVTSGGLFTGTLTAVGFHHINYSVSNEAGSTNYALTMQAFP